MLLVIRAWNKLTQNNFFLYTLRRHRSEKNKKTQVRFALTIIKLPYRCLPPPPLHQPPFKKTHSFPENCGPTETLFDIVKMNELTLHPERDLCGKGQTLKKREKEEIHPKVASVGLEYPVPLNCIIPDDDDVKWPNLWFCCREATFKDPWGVVFHLAGSELTRNWNQWRLSEAFYRELGDLFDNEDSHDGTELCCFAGFYLRWSWTPQ